MTKTNKTTPAPASIFPHAVRVGDRLANISGKVIGKEDSVEGQVIFTQFGGRFVFPYNFKIEVHLGSL